MTNVETNIDTGIEYYANTIGQATKRYGVNSVEAAFRSVMVTSADNLPALADRIVARIVEIRAERSKARHEVQKLEIASATKFTHLFVSVCEVANCYGGPEEGGWYYDSYSAPLATIEVSNDISNDRLAKVKQALLKQIGIESADYAGHGCGGCGDDDGLMRGQSFNEGYSFQYSNGTPFVPGPRPHYE